MKTTQLEKSIQKVLELRNLIEMQESDPMLQQNFENELQKLKMDYSQYLNDVLFDIYDEYCEDDPCPCIEEFLKSKMVYIHPEDFPTQNALLEIKTSTLRFEITDPNRKIKEVVWEAA